MPATKSVFISYRRKDSHTEAASLSRLLCEKFGVESVFMDTAKIDPGDSWPDEISEALQSCQVVLVLIGQGWLSACDAYGRRRIDSDSDWIRREVQHALETGKTVIPVLVDGAVLPPKEALPDCLQLLPSRQKIELRPDYWESDVQILLDSLRAHIGSAGEGVSSLDGGRTSCDPVGVVSESSRQFLQNIRKLIDQSRAPMYLTDTDLIIQHCNEELAHLLHSTRAAITDNSVYSLAMRFADRVPTTRRDQFKQRQEVLIEILLKDLAPHSQEHELLDNRGIPGGGTYAKLYRVAIDAHKLHDPEDVRCELGIFVTYGIQEVTPEEVGLEA